ncbi:MAG: sigma-70 family RNA polymerase sigma factor [Fibrobacter sp.]|nr:sigma-70 family RNA polymerase sigma factor [Fibrobacter sp.]
MVSTNKSNEEKTDEWLEKTWDSYSPQIYNLCRVKCGNKEDAMDVFQNVALRFCQNAKKIAYDDSIFPWLTAVFKNCFYDYVRFRQKLYPFSRASDIMGDYMNLSADRSVFFREGNKENDELNRAVGSLSERDRTLINLTFKKGLSTEELSVLYGVSANTIVKRRHSAIKRAKAALLG